MKKIIEYIFKFFANISAFIIVGFLIAPIVAVFIIELLKYDKLSITSKSLILAYCLFGAYLLGAYITKDSK